MKQRKKCPYDGTDQSQAAGWTASVSLDALDVLRELIFRRDPQDEAP